MRFRRLLEQAVATPSVTAEDVRHGFYRLPVPDTPGTGRIRLVNDEFRVEGGSYQER